MNVATPPQTTGCTSQTSPRHLRRGLIGRALIKRIKPGCEGKRNAEQRTGARHWFCTCKRLIVRDKYEVGTRMQPTAFQKIAFVVLIALMFGVTTGLLGGL